jgi:hypothetical protein
VRCDDFSDDSGDSRRECGQVQKSEETSRIGDSAARDFLELVDFRYSPAGNRTLV